MFRLRLIRTAINLSLIIVMMIQPGIALVSANDCGADCGSSFLCEGCGCCKVASPEDKCCCCGGEHSDGEKSYCMGGTESEDFWNSFDEIVHADETLELKVTVISTTEPAAIDGCEPVAGSSQASDLVFSTCGCGFESPPLGESVPSRPTVSQRQSVAIRHSDLVDLFGGSMFPRPRRRDVGEVLPSPHFSQVQLCVWRL